MDTAVPSHDRILLALTPSDWGYLHGKEKRLAKSFGHALGVYPKKIDFSSGFGPLLAAKIRRISPESVMNLLGAVKAELHFDEAHGDHAGPGPYRDALPAGLRRILDLPADVFPHPDRFEHDHCDHVGTAAAEATGSGEDTVARLETLQPLLMREIASFGEAVAAGIRPVSDPARAIAEWQSLWAQLPEAATTLAAARAALDAQAEFARLVAADERLLRAVACLRFADDDPRAAVAAIAGVQQSAAETRPPLGDETRDSYEALLRVLAAEYPDDNDAQTVQGTFGMPALTAAVRLSPIPILIPTPADFTDYEPDRDELGVLGFSTAPTRPGDAPAGKLPPGGNAEPESHTDDIGSPLIGGSDQVLPAAPITDGDASTSPVIEVDASVEGAEAEQASPNDEIAAGNAAEDSAGGDATAPADTIVATSGPTETPAGEVASSAGALPREDEAAPTEAHHRRVPAREGTAPRLVGRDRGPGDYLAPFDAAAAAADFALAYWYAVAGHDETRARAARMLVLSTSAELTVGSSPQARANALASQLGADLAEAPSAVTELIAAALVPAALLLPPYSDATVSLNTARGRLGDDCPAFVRIASLLTYDRGSGLQTLEAPVLLANRDQAKLDLAEIVSRAPNRTIRFQRATEVWRELVRQQGLLGGLASKVLAGPVDNQLREALAEIEQRGIDRVIKDIDHQLNPNLAKKQGIIAGAKQELASSMQRYLDAIRAYLVAQESVRAIDRGTHNNTDLIEGLIGSLPVDPSDAGFGALTTGVARWLRARLDGQQESQPSTSEADSLARPLSKAFELVRATNRDFDPQQVTLELLAAQAARTTEEAFAGYAERHDHVGLEVLLDSVRSADPALAPGLEQRERRARTESRETLQRAVERTRVSLSRALASTSLTEAEAQEYLNRLEQVGRDQNPHYRDALTALDDIQAELTRRQQTRLDAARKQLTALPDISEPTRNRIVSLIEARDLLSAEEFLAHLSNGATSLPEEDAENRMLEEFWPAASEAADGGPSWFAERLAEGRVAGLPLPHPSASPRIRAGLESWERLASEGRTRGFEARVMNVLHAIGFQQQVRLGPRFSAGRATSDNVFEARYDGYALIPTFGSQARGAYALFLGWERKTVDGLLQAVRNAQVTQSRPTVVLYFQTLKPGERRLLAEQSRRKGFSHIVIDNAAMAYLGTREEARIDALMHVCLPFAGPNPYTPFVLGDVPREMFYGRRDELRAVQDLHGPLFVYGGRQLGKSALLKTAMSEFGKSDPNHVSIYVDLKAEGVGEWRKADDLWRVLLPNLQARGIVSEKVSRQQSNPDVVVDQVGAWLAADERRQLLLLLDESDAFLDEDSRPRTGGKGQFKNVYLLKNLMNQSSRRFKPVFAGLHQVQRFHKESNGPMAHVGTEIAVGPLPPAEAYKLVVRPLEAIGYRFASPDVVWRMLSHTNYQASLIQLFCKELVNDLKSRKLSLHEPPTMIDAATVDRVYENKELRGQIAQRFDWTIQLDNRYRVIALVAAWLNLADEGAVAPIPQLRSQCADFWPVGFDGVTQDEFRALLDEMVGLGVLVRSRQDYYGIRSPNVIRLLGSKDEIERKLLESSSLELPTVFDPTRYRRKLGTVLERSPITEAQAARMLANASVPTLITATEALGADRLGPALTEIADSGEGVDIYTTSVDELPGTLTEVARKKRNRHILLDARGASAEALTEAVRRLARQTVTSATLTGSILITPPDRHRLDLPDVNVREVTLQPWSDAELHAVEPEADVPLTSDTRAQLLDITGGWPDVLEPVLAHGRQNGVAGLLAAAKDDAQRVVDGGWEPFAARLGVIAGSREEGVLTSLMGWDETISREDLADLLPPWPVEELSDVLLTLTSCGAVHVSQAPARTGDLGAREYRLNPLVARTLRGPR